MRTLHQQLPSAGPEREILREKGQFWTPDWVAEAMVGYVAAGNARGIFDPSVGAGAFFRAAKKIESDIGRKLELIGAEIDAAVLAQARGSGLSDKDLNKVQITDFVLDPPVNPLPAIVANPPYIRHHRLSSDVKAKLKHLGACLIGEPLDGRAGYHVYFLLRALQLLDLYGRLAFIMPADTCEGVFAPKLWNWITANYRLEAVVTFAPKATPFPCVDTNAIIFLIKNAAPTNNFCWAICNEPNTNELKRWMLSDLTSEPGKDIEVCKRQLSEGLTTGLSRPASNAETSGLTLGDVANVLRGVATGGNKFFFLTSRQTEDLGIPREFLIPAVGRTRDVTGAELTTEDLQALDQAGRPTLLLSVNGYHENELPPAVREYLRHGEKLGLDKRPLIATRRPWYKMEVRAVPPILFAYLGRRNTRFIRNQAGVVPLTGFLCVYPRRRDADFVDKLWQVLQHPQIADNLKSVGKSYGDGAIKVEPRALEKLRLPTAAVAETGLEPLDRELSSQLKLQIVMSLQGVIPRHTSLVTNL
jgi:adenine-specific DNA-methyltransferase